MTFRNSNDDTLNMTTTTAMENYPDLSDEGFLKTLVHESNNFLSPISGFTELALMDIEDNSPIQSYLEEVLFSVRENTEFNQLLLMLSGHHLPALETVSDLDIEIMLMDNIFRFQQKGEEYKIKSNKNWMQRLFKTFEVLAYSFKQQIIPLTVEQNNEMVCLEFIFDPGIRRVDVEKLFQPFYTTRSISSEKGLGICWIPAFMKSVQGSTETNIIANGKIQIILCFKSE